MVVQVPDALTCSPYQRLYCFIPTSFYPLSSLFEIMGLGCSGLHSERKSDRDREVVRALKEPKFTFSSSACGPKRGRGQPSAFK